jgi:hypothetical protein
MYGLRVWVWVVAQRRPSIKSTVVLKISGMTIFIGKTHAAKE